MNSSNSRSDQSVSNPKGPEFLSWKSALGNMEVLSVSDLAGRVKTILEDGFSFIRLRGEVSGLYRAASGHVYFDLKDAGAKLNCICWRGSAKAVSGSGNNLLVAGASIADGVEVIADGMLTVYPARSTYQLRVKKLLLAGRGALLAMIEQRRQKLTSEGLFDSARKKPLPFAPAVIGLITSSGGAALFDILSRLDKRWPCRVLLWPVLVQGDDAPRAITAALQGFNAFPTAINNGELPRPDVVIIARGGGSVEDLLAFQDESLVRAVAASVIPVISAVGHETDTTLIDLASDQREPTPTAAAERATPVWVDLADKVNDYRQRLGHVINRMVDAYAQSLRGAYSGLTKVDWVISRKADQVGHMVQRLAYFMSYRVDEGRVRLQEARLGLTKVDWLVDREVENIGYIDQRLRRGVLVLVTECSHLYRLQVQALTPQYLPALARDRGTKVSTLTARLETAWGTCLEGKSNTSQVATRLLEALSYRQTLQRGYAVVRRINSSTLVHRTESLRPGHKVEIEFKDGQVAAEVNWIKPALTKGS